MEFRNVNVNPKGWKNEGDCVIRAISSATNKEWIDVYMDLAFMGSKKCRMPNSKRVYEEYLDKQGWTKYKMPRHSDNSRYTVEELANELSNKNMIISVANHLTYVESGTLMDTWNCSHKSVGNYWIKEGK